MSRRLRTLFILSDLLGGGAERVVLDLLRGLDRSRFDPALLLLKRDGVYWNEVADDVRLDHVVEAGGRLRRRLPRVIGKVLGRSTWADVIVGGLEFDPTYTAILAGFVARKPVVGWVHTSMEPYLQIVAPRARRAVHWFYPRLAAVVCTSQGAAQALHTAVRVRPERVHVIPNLVNLGRLQVMAGGEFPGWASRVLTKPTVVGVGRLLCFKGFDLLIEAHARLRASGVDHHLLILGDGPSRPALEALAKRLEVHASVFMPGFVPNPYPLVHQSQVFALASRLEGMPVVIVEALALGVPIVSADCRSGPAELLEGGRYGILVPPGDSGALADAIGRILGDAGLRVSLAAEGRKRAAAYAPDEVVPLWERLLHDVSR